MIRTNLAVVAAKSAARLSRRLSHGGATSLPGLVGLRIDPHLVRHLSRDLTGTIVVTGTNGKTTTARFISQSLTEAGYHHVHNQAGSNLLRGIASSLTVAQPLPDEQSKTWGLFEVDEATMPEACQELQPTIVLVTNLFRDQLDRYGELQQTARLIRRGLEQLPRNTVVVLNADDPLVASLGDNLSQRILYYGIADTSVSRHRLPPAADHLASPQNGELLSYDAVFVGHLGHYRSSAGDITRPEPDISLTKLRLQGLQSSALEISTPADTVKLTLPLPGLYNAYNALAAVAVGYALDLKPTLLRRAIAKTAAAFGRLEHVNIRGQKLFISLIKNPTGSNEVINTLALDRKPKDVLIIINDNFADGRDISWLWDTDFEILIGQLRSVGVAGRRARDMALRLKYAGLPETEVVVYSEVDRAVTESLKRLPKNGTLYVLPTYTAMLELRQYLTARGHLTHYLD